MTRPGLIGVVPIAALHQFWPQVTEWLEAALAVSLQHELSVQSLWRGLQSGEYTLLVIGDRGEHRTELMGACAVMKGIRADGQMYVGILCAGGRKVEQWVGPLVRFCQRLGRDMGAVEVVCVGRVGWRPLLVALGARQAASIFKIDCDAGGDHG